MATVHLTCGHPAIVTHWFGVRLIRCAIPLCPTADVVTALPVTEVTYTTRQFMPPPVDEEEAS